MPRGELSTRSIVVDALARGKIVFVPYVHAVKPADDAASQTKMDMLSLKSKEEYDSLKPDRWGIPTLEAASIEHRRNAFGGFGLERDGLEKETGRLDLILVPGMAFDRDQRRLGHGKGYYDRFLCEYHESLVGGGRGRPMPFLGEIPSPPNSSPILISPLAALSLCEQLLPPDAKVPVGEHDWTMDAVIAAGDK